MGSNPIFSSFKKGQAIPPAHSPSFYFYVNYDRPNIKRDIFKEKKDS